MLFCPNCRSEVPPHARVCPRCGFTLVDPTKLPASNQIEEKHQQEPAPITQQPFRRFDHQPGTLLPGNERSIPQSGRTSSEGPDSPMLQGPITPSQAVRSKPLTPKRLKKSFAPITPLPSTQLSGSSVLSEAPSSTPMRQLPHRPGFKPVENTPPQENEPRPAQKQQWEPGHFRPEQHPQPAIAPPSGIEIVRQPTTTSRALAAKEAETPMPTASASSVLSQAQTVAVQNVLRQAAVASTNSVIRVRRKPYHKQHADFWILAIVLVCLICLLGLYIVLTYHATRMSQPSPTMLAAITRIVTRI